MECWRDVVGYEGFYEVSSFGRVRRIAVGAGNTPRLRHLSLGTSGYLSLVLSKRNVKKNHMVHRLVAICFIGHPPSAVHQVAHADGDKLNNFADNLRWATPRENNFDKYSHGTAVFSNGRRYGVLSDEDVVRIRLDPRQYSSVASQFNITPAMVGSIKRKECYSRVSPEVNGISCGKRKHKNIADDVVRSIRADSRNNQEIADDVGVNRSVIWRIKNGDIYKNVT